MQEQYAEIDELEEVYEGQSFDTVEEEVSYKERAISKLFDVDDVSYRKSLLKTVQSICMYNPKYATDMFYKVNWKAVVESGLFNKERLNWVVDLAKMRA